MNCIKVVRLKPDQPNQWLRVWYCTILYFVMHMHNVYYLYASSTLIKINKTIWPEILTWNLIWHFDDLYAVKLLSVNINSIWVQIHGWAAHYPQCVSAKCPNQAKVMCTCASFDLNWIFSFSLLQKYLPVP